VHFCSNFGRKLRSKLPSRNSFGRAPASPRRRASQAPGARRARAAPYHRPTPPGALHCSRPPFPLGNAPSRDRHAHREPQESALSCVALECAHARSYPCCPRATRPLPVAGPSFPHSLSLAPQGGHRATIKEAPQGELARTHHPCPSCSADAIRGCRGEP
jgi:hypothetical protein